MTIPSLPKLPLPSPLVGSETNSFTEYTVTQRMPGIARRVIVENNFPADINERLEKLASELSSQGNVPPLGDDCGADFPEWEKYLEPYQGKRWIDVPWFFAETYFYRLILEITNYFRDGNFYEVDVFAFQKNQGLEGSFNSIISLCSQLNKWLVEPSKIALTALIYFALWGNRVDLSLWSATESERSHFDIDSQIAHILVNDSPQVIEFLTSDKKGRIDFVIDNSGFELVCDLCLVDYLLGSGITNEVHLHLKPHPTFVSDAMIKDVYHTIEFFLASQNQELIVFAQRLQEYLRLGRLLLREDYFWTSPLAFWEIPKPLKNEISNADLLFVKGDANYRKLLGDRHWDFTTDISDIICYLPIPMVALRTLKSEVAAGIEPEVVERLQESDPSWLTNGQWGLILSLIHI